MNNKIIAIAVVLILVFFGWYYIVGASEPDFDWGEGDITGTGSLRVEMLTEDGEIIDVSDVSPMAIFYEGFHVTQITVYVTVTAVDNTGQYEKVQLNFRGGLGLQCEFKMNRLDTGSTFLDQDHNMLNPGNNEYPIIIADGDIANSASTTGATLDLVDATSSLGSYEGGIRLTVTLKSASEFAYRGCDASGTALTDWYTANVPTGVVRSFDFFFGDDLFTFNWDIGGDPQP